MTYAHVLNQYTILFQTFFNAELHKQFNLETTDNKLSAVYTEERLRWKYLQLIQSAIFQATHNTKEN